jgi:hypothetical protein
MMGDTILSPFRYDAACTETPQELARRAACDSIFGDYPG